MYNNNNNNSNYLAWLMCWTSVEFAHHRAVRSPLQPL